MDKNTRPEITISSLDQDRLYTLIESLPANSFAGKDELEAELGRANVVDPTEIPPTIVTMNSTVKFTVESTKTNLNSPWYIPKMWIQAGRLFPFWPRLAVRCLGCPKGTKLNGPSRVGACSKSKLPKLFTSLSGLVSSSGKAQRLAQRPPFTYPHITERIEMDAS